MSSLLDLNLDKNLYKLKPLENEDVSLVSKAEKTFIDTPSESLVSGEIDGNIDITGGFLQSKNYVNGSAGWHLSAEGIIYAVGAEISGTITASTIEIGTDAFHVDIDGNMWWGSSTTYAGATIKISSAGSVDLTTGTFSGALIGNTINIPDATTPLFAVDSSGNVACKSLRREDLHWYTLFESIDGYTTGGTAPTLVSSGIEMTTGTSSADSSTIKKTLNFNDISWNKKRSMFAIVYLDSADFEGGQQTFLFGIGNIDSANARKMIFKIDDENIYGVMGNGTSEESVLLGTITALGLSGSYVKYSIVFDPTDGCKFYLNDVEKGALSTYIPTGTGQATEIFSFDLVTDENSAKVARINYYDFWEAL